MSFHSTVANYPTLQEAEDAIRHLTDNGFAAEQLSVTTQDLTSEKHVRGYVTATDIAGEGAFEGAWIGGLMGLIFGAAFVWVPHFGVVIEAGTLSAAFLGAFEGVIFGIVGGAIFGALLGWVISKRHIIKYDEQLSGGRHFVAVTGSWQEVKRAHELLREEDLSAIKVEDTSGQETFALS